MASGTFETENVAANDIQSARQALAAYYPESPAHIERFAAVDHFAVLKLSGATIDDPQQLEIAVKDLVTLQQIGLYPVVVHGGGNQIDKALAGRQSEKRDGLRITPPDHMPAISEALSAVNATLVQAIEAQGGRAVGVQNIFAARISDPANVASVEGLTDIDTAVIKQATAAGEIAVVSCIGHNAETGQLVNINADISASELALELDVLKCILLLQEGGILRDGQRLPQPSQAVIEEMIGSGEIHGGMVPKVQAALKMAQLGVPEVVIASPANLLTELLSDNGAGTIIHDEHL